MVCRACGLTGKHRRASEQWCGSGLWPKTVTAYFVSPWVRKSAWSVSRVAWLFGGGSELSTEHTGHADCHQGAEREKNPFYNQALHAGWQVSRWEYSISLKKGFGITAISCVLLLPLPVCARTLAGCCKKSYKICLFLARSYEDWRIDELIIPD
jgi:hypothetical protein